MKVTLWDNEYVFSTARWRSVMFILQKLRMKIKNKNTTNNLVLFSKTLPLLQIKELLKYFMFINHNFFYYRALENTHLWPFNKSKFNLKSDRFNLPAPVSPITCQAYLTNVRAIQYKLGPERLTRRSEIQIYYGCPWEEHKRLEFQNLILFCKLKTEYAVLWTNSSGFIWDI